MKKRALLTALALSLAYKLRIVDPGKAVNKMGRWVKGVTVEELGKLSAAVSDEILIPSIYKKALEEIVMHKKNNAKLVILSSTINQVGRKMSEHLGFDDILCSKLEEADGILTGRPDGPFCIGEE